MPNKQEEINPFLPSYLANPAREPDLSRAFSVIESELIPTYKEKLEQNKNRAFIVCKKLMKKCIERNPIVAKHIRLPKKEALQTLDTASFDFRILLKPFDIQESFRTVSGLNNDIPPGYSLFPINSRLTPPERMAIRKTWALCLDINGYLSPNHINVWLVPAIEASFKALQGDGDLDLVKCHVFNDEGFLTILVSPAPGQGRTSSDSITVNLFPAVKGYGWPEGTELKPPMPATRPYSDAGLACLNEIQVEMVGDGQSAYYLEAKPALLCNTLQPQHTHGHCTNVVTQYKYYPHNRQVLWKFSFAPARDKFASCMRQYRDGACNPDLALNVLQLIRQNFDPFNTIWNVLTLGRCMDIMLWNFRKNASRMHNPTECFLNFMKTAGECVYNASLPHFLFPTVNILDFSKTSTAEELGENLLGMEEEFEEDSSSILYCTGCRKRPNSPSNHSEEEEDEAMIN